MFLYKYKTVINYAKDSSFLLRNVSLSHYFSTSSINKKQSTVSEILIHKHNFSPKLAEKVVLSRSINPHRADSILSYLKETGFSSTQLEKMVESKHRFHGSSLDRVLASSLDKVIKPKIKIFQDLGFSSNDIAEIITNDPDILHRSADNRIIPGIAVLRDLLGSNIEVAKLLKTSGCWFLKYDTATSLALNFEYLKSLGVQVEHITWLMYTFPRSLLCKPEKMKGFVAKIDETGIKRSSKMFIHAIRVLSSLTTESWELKLQGFRDLGYSEDEIVAAFRSAPQVFAVSVEKMKKVKEAVVGTGKYDLLCIVNYPTAFICSIEKRIKPRAEVLRFLERKNLIKKWPSFSVFHKYTDAQFFRKYVAPNLDEVKDLWLGKSGLTGKKDRKFNITLEK